MGSANHCTAVPSSKNFLLVEFLLYSPLFKKNPPQ